MPYFTPPVPLLSHLFPHGTSSLSVTNKYLAYGDGPCNIHTRDSLQAALL